MNWILIVLLSTALFQSSCAQEKSGNGKKGDSQVAEPKNLQGELVVEERVESWLSRYDIEDKNPRQVILPPGLSEASGLAIAGDGTLFCHNDEIGIVYKIDGATGRIVKQFSIGAFTVRGDFEGIAVKGEMIYLVTSEGNIFEFREGKNKQNVPYTMYRTPLSSKNNVEGLEYDPETDCLLLACKGDAGKGLGKYKAVYAFSLKTQKLLEDPRFLIPVEEVDKKAHRRGFNPSGIARHPQSGTFFVISATGESIVELSPNGTLLDQKELPRKANSQPEGISFGSDLTMYICNDNKRGNGTLSIYPVKGMIAQ